jgi:hypothetical protein
MPAKAKGGCVTATNGTFSIYLARARVDCWFGVIYDLWRIGGCMECLLECESCLYWEDTHNSYDGGHCHRRAPVCVGMDDRKEGIGCWPMTYKWDWCGDFEKKECGE